MYPQEEKRGPDGVRHARRKQQEGRRGPTHLWEEELELAVFDVPAGRNRMADRVRRTHGRKN